MLKLKIAGEALIEGDLSPISLLYVIWVQQFIGLWLSSSCLCPSSLRLNILRKLIADEVDFVPHVTQLDLRDNKLGDLDAMVFNNIEVLHCERNQLVTLSICGYVLKALYASSNGECRPHPTCAVCPVPSSLLYQPYSFLIY